MDAGDFAWVEAADERLSALTITLVQPDDGSAIKVLTPRSRYPKPMAVEEALEATLAIDDFAYGAVIVQADSIAGWTALVEPNGWATTDADRLAALSNLGTAVSAFWNVNANMQFGLARGGVIVRLFDPLLYHPSNKALPDERGLEWGVAHPRASALALVEALTGVAIERDWLLDRQRDSYIVPL